MADAIKWGRPCDCGAMLTVDVGLQPLEATDRVVCPACHREHPGDTLERQEWHFFGTTHNAAPAAQQEGE